MVFALFRRSGNRQTIDRLHEAIVAAARQESLYRDYRVADDVDGRFELLVLHAALLVRRLNSAGPPGPDMAQDLTDVVFRRLDSTLREVGIGDTSVPKRMKKLAEAFFGRAGAYEVSLAAADPEALAGALDRNVFGGEGPAESTQRLRRYVQSAAGHLDSRSVQEISSGMDLFPTAANIN